MKSELFKDDNREYIVYKHTTPNNKIYIGITSQGEEKRWKGGFGYQTQEYFFRAIVKYGWINIEHTILEKHLTLQEALDKEIKYIAFYDSTNPKKGYNITPGGNVKNDEMALRISKGRNKNAAPKLVIPKGSVGRHVIKYNSEDTIVKTFCSVIEAAFDALVLKETFRNRLNQIGIYRVGQCYYKYENNQYSRYRPIVCYTMDGQFIKEYPTAMAAERETGISNKNINAVCRGKKHSAGRKIWRYKDENTNS